MTAPRLWRRVGFAAATLLGTLALVGWLAVGDRPEDLRDSITTEFPHVLWVDVPTLDAWRSSEAPPVLLDARAPEEFAVSHLLRAQRVDPDHPDLDALAELRTRRIVVYCSVGYRSAKVAQTLGEAHFPRVYNLEGGIFAWANAGKPVYADGREVHHVHPFDRVWGRFLRAELRSVTPATPPSHR